MKILLGERVAIGVALLFAVVAVAGFGLFGIDPHRLANRPELIGIYTASFRVFAQGQVWITGAACAYVLATRTRTAWLPALGTCYAISLCSELLGTTFGIPFGAYAYASTLGPMWLSRVPVIIPLSWFLMALPSYAIAARWMAGMRRVFAGSLVLLLWDLVLDPAMSHVTNYWRWEHAGPYFGMPLLNLFGWYVTGLALLGALHALRVTRWTILVPGTIWIAFYAINLVVPAGMMLARALT